MYLTRILQGGDFVAQGSAVDLLISLGPLNEVTVPKVVGEIQDNARTAIKGAKLGVGAITQQHSDTVDAGYVSDQDPAAGSLVAEGSFVNLVISSGPLTVPEEDKSKLASLLSEIRGKHNWQWRGGDEKTGDWSEAERILIELQRKSDQYKGSSKGVMPSSDPMNH
jgi:serine/threonine-protein kinase